MGTSVLPRLCGEGSSLPTAASPVFLLVVGIASSRCSFMQPAAKSWGAAAWSLSSSPPRTSAKAATAQAERLKQEALACLVNSKQSGLRGTRSNHSPPVHSDRPPRYIPIGAKVSGMYLGKVVSGIRKEGDWRCSVCGAVTCRKEHSKCYVCAATRPRPQRGNSHSISAATGTAKKAAASAQDAVTLSQPTPGQQHAASIKLPVDGKESGKILALATARRALAATVKPHSADLQPTVSQSAGASPANAVAVPPLSGNQHSVVSALANLATPVGGSSADVPLGSFEILIQSMMAKLPGKSTVLAPMQALLTTIQAEAANPPEEENAATPPLRSPSQWVAHHKREAATKVTELANYCELVTRKTAEAAVQRATHEAELQQHIVKAQTDLDGYRSAADAAVEKWRIVNSEKEESIRKQLAEAEANLAEAIKEAERAGNLAHTKPRLPSTPCDSDDEDGVEDIAVDADSSAVTAATCIGDQPVVINAFINPPVLDVPLDDPTLARALLAQNVLLHALQQPTPPPLTFADIGITPAEVTLLIGLQAWSTEHAAAQEVKPGSLLPRSFTGILLTALARLPAQAAAAAGKDQGWQEVSQAKLKAAAQTEAAAKLLATASKKAKRAVTKSGSRVKRSNK